MEFISKTYLFDSELPKSNLLPLSKTTGPGCSIWKLSIMNYFWSTLCNFYPKAKHVCWAVFWIQKCIVSLQQPFTSGRTPNNCVKIRTFLLLLRKWRKYLSFAHKRCSLVSRIGECSTQIFCHIHPSAKKNIVAKNGKNMLLGIAFPITSFLFSLIKHL